MRKVEITDPKILKILKEKRDLSKENQKIIKEMEELEKKYNKNISKSKRADERSRPKIYKQVDKMELGEYEEISRVHEEDGKWYIEITDRMEEFKKQWEDKKKEDKNNTK